jgi:tryptophan synthase beta chain
MKSAKKPFPRKVNLGDDEFPDRFTNLKPFMKRLPGPPLNPGTKQPISPSDLEPLFPEGLIKDEVSMEDAPIPGPVREIMKSYRPTPLYYASGLRAALKTPAHIFYKYEGVSPTGSHKSNTALAQAYYVKQAGGNRIVTETGAGQWGCALAHACAMFGLEAKVYMVRVSHDQKPGRRALIRSFGATVVPSPSPDTPPGRAILEQDPNSPGSLGIAISEAVADAVSREDTYYSLGSVLDSVLMHQSVIGQEAMKQMEKLGSYPDVVIGCAGGGSNFAGLAFPFARAKLEGKTKTRFLAVESDAAPKLTTGEYRHDHGDTAGMTPLLLMYTLGHTFMPAPVHAGGLRYHGMAPLVSALVKDGVFEARSYPQRAAFEAGVLFTRAEGILPAPESAHAVRAAIDEAVKAREAGKETVILFNLSGHGYFDTAGYDEYLAGKMA